MNESFMPIGVERTRTSPSPKRLAETTTRRIGKEAARMEFVQDHEPLMLIKAAETVSLAMRRHLQKANDKITLPQMMVLTFLKDNEDALIGDVARATRLQASSLTGILERMEESGWIKRRKDKDDKRAVRLKTTPNGARLLQKIQRANRSFLNEFNKSLSASERKALRNSCKKLFDTFGDETE